MTGDDKSVRAAAVKELIAIGRDREAVDAATRGSKTQGEPMDGVQQLDEIFPLLRSVVGNISPEDLDAQTPCANFTVTGVLEHMVGGAAFFAPGFRGETPAAGDAAPATTQLLEQWSDAMADLQGAVHTPGAQERTMPTPIGEQPGATFARYIAFDGLVHGWDLAVATGQPYNPRAELVAEVETFVRSLIKPEMRDGDTFAAETTPTPNATPIEKLAAFSGRTIPKETQR